jgi:ABC-type bacteriocin/lantibiotic exporter with double-glycine peptidase domain
MRFVRQKSDLDCGIACVAMVSGRGYAAAKRAFGKGAEKRPTKASEVVDALRRLGVACRKNRVRCRTAAERKRLRDSDKTAIVGVKIPESEVDWHWIVWDAKRKEWRDPERCPEERYVRPRILFYLKMD